MVIMGSPSDMVHGEKIRDLCLSFGFPCHLRVSSAHKGTDETLNIVAQYEGITIKTCGFKYIHIVISPNLKLQSFRFNRFNHLGLMLFLRVFINIFSCAGSHF